MNRFSKAGKEQIREIVREELKQAQARREGFQVAELGMQPDTCPTPARANDEPMITCGPIKPLTQETLDEYAEVSGIQLVLKE